MGNYILAIKNLRIGEYSHVNQGAILDARAEICIGSNVSISHRASLFSLSHDYNSPSFAGMPGKIKIEDYVFVGANATILGGRKGITIGRGAVVCAGSVVTHDVEPFDVVAGVPARVIGKRNEDVNYFPLKGDVNWRFL
jgi:acetyltransferase-like isoleucine patch superfamily enzyme